MRHFLFARLVRMKSTFANEHGVYVCEHVHLLDTWALGVKDSFMQRVSFEQYEHMMIPSQK